MTAVDDWLTWLERDRGRSANTRKLYTSVIHTLDAFPDPRATELPPTQRPLLHIDPLTATKEEIELWWRARSVDADDQARPHSSRNVELAVIRSFYAWCERFDLRTDNPTRRIDPLKQQRRTSRFIGDSELHHLLAHLDEPMRRAVALGAYGGLRVSEAAALTWGDIDIDRRRMIVRGKGDKERSVGLSTPLLNVILPDTGGNVVTGTNEAYAGHYLQMKVNDAMKRNGATLTFHALRHRFGFMAVAGGAKPTALALAMGHASLTTTMGYVAPLDSDLDLIADAVTR